MGIIAIVNSLISKFTVIFKHILQIRLGEYEAGPPTTFENVKLTSCLGLGSDFLLKFYVAHLCFNTIILLKSIIITLDLTYYHHSALLIPFLLFLCLLYLTMLLSIAVFYVTHCFSPVTLWNTFWEL